MLSYALDLHWRRRSAAAAAAAPGAIGAAEAAAEAAPPPAPQLTSPAKRGRAAAADAQPDKQQQPDAQQQTAAAGLAAGAAAAKAAAARQASALASEADYGLLSYLAYVLYAPLYIAGPIITYQDWAWQLRQRAPPPAGAVLRYAARFAADWACLEALTHCLYFNSIAKYRIGLRYRQYGLRYSTLEMGETMR